MISRETTQILNYVPDPLRALQRAVDQGSHIPRILSILRSSRSFA